MNFPQSLAVLAAMAMATSAISIATRNAPTMANMVINGDFGNKSQNAPNPKIWRYDPSAADVYLDQEMRFFNEKHAETQIEQLITTQLGNYYTLSYRVKACPVAAVRNQLFIGDMMISLLPGSDEWRSFDSLPFKGSGPNDSLALIGGAPVGKTCSSFWDDFVVKPATLSETPADDAKQLVHNGDFDDRDLSGWDRISIQGHGQQAFALGAGSDGWSFTWTTANFSFSQFRMSQTMKLDKNNDYVLSFEHWADTEVDGFIGIQFRDAAMPYVIPDQDSLNFEFRNTNPPAWATETRRFKALFEDNLLTFTIQNYNRGTHLVDNIKLLKCKDQ